MIAAIQGWIERRFPVREILSLGRDEEITGGASFFYTLGSATLFVFLIQIATGIWQLFYYVPTVDHAYDSLLYLRTEIDFGWLIHGLHYWGANLMSVLVGLHLVRVFVWGAYKEPRQITWLTGVALLLLTAMLVFTGAPLPWDEAGFWVATVGMGILSTVPLVGPLLAQVMRGGGSLGPIALSRFFVLHAAILPAAMLGVVGLHMVAFRQFGSVGPWKAERRRTSGPFWPDQIFKDLMVSTLLLLLLVWLSAYHPAPVSGPADPTDTTYRPMPEWNFLFLFEALKLLPGKLEPVGTVGIPGLAVILLAGVPFLDRSAERDPRRRPIAMAALVATLAVVSALTIAALRSATTAATIAARAPAAAGKPSASAMAGRRLFVSLGCVGCHSVQGRGGTVGPDLTNEGAEHGRSWVIAQIMDPTQHDPHTTMPAYASLTAAQANQIVDYLFNATATGLAAASPRLARSAAEPAGTAASGASSPAPPPAQDHPGRAAAIVGSAAHGAVLYDTYCASCHGVSGRGGIPSGGPGSRPVPALVPIAAAIYDAAPASFAANLDGFVQHGAATSPAGALEMPAFGETGTLSQQEIADVEAWVMQRNGVDRAALVNAGIAPRRYFALAAGASGTLALLLALAFVLGHSPRRSPGLARSTRREGQR